MPDEELVRRTLKGHREASIALVDRLTPIIQKRAGWVLSRHSGHSRTDLLDYTQDVLVRLIDRDYRVLRTWDPARGASLATFVALVAEREILTILRSGRRSAWKEDPTLDVDLDRKVEAPSLELDIEARDLLERLLDHLAHELNPKARLLFHALYIEELPAEHVAKRFGMTPNALYSWRSRFKARVAEWVDLETK